MSQDKPLMIELFAGLHGWGIEFYCGLPNKRVAFDNVA